MLLVLQFYGYENFAPDQQSFNDQAAASIMVFWVLVIVLVVIAQNIILAIVADAYGSARDELQVRGIIGVQSTYVTLQPAHHFARHTVCYVFCVNTHLITCTFYSTAGLYTSH